MLVNVAFTVWRRPALKIGPVTRRRISVRWASTGQVDSCARALLSTR